MLESIPLRRSPSKPYYFKKHFMTQTEQLYTPGKKAGPLGTLFKRDDTAITSRRISSSQRVMAEEYQDEMEEQDAMTQSPARRLIDAFKASSSPVIRSPAAMSRRPSTTTSISGSSDNLLLAPSPTIAPTSLFDTLLRSPSKNRARSRRSSSVSIPRDLASNSAGPSRPATPSRLRVSAQPGVEEEIRPTFVIYRDAPVSISSPTYSQISQEPSEAKEEEYSYSEPEDKENSFMPSPLAGEAIEVDGLSVASHRTPPSQTASLPLMDEESSNKRSLPEPPDSDHVNSQDRVSKRLRGGTISA